MANLQKSLVKKYRDLFGISNIDFNEYGDTIFKTNITCAETMVKGDLNTNTVSEIGGNLTSTNIQCDNCTATNLNISETSTFQVMTTTNVDVTNDCYVSTNVVTENLISNNISVNSDFNCSINKSTDILTNNIFNDSSITIDSNNITIGNTNSIITFSGTTNNIISTDLNIKDRLIYLNNSNDDSKTSFGFIINTTSEDGFLMYTMDNGFIAKAPLQENDSHTLITFFDNNKNITVSGNSLLYGNVTVLNNLNISNNCILQESLTTTNIFVSDNVSCSTITSTNYNISSIGYITNNLTTNSMFTDELLCNSNLICDANLSVDNLYGKDSLTISSNLNILNDLMVLNDCTVLSNTTINSNLIVTNITCNNNAHLHDVCITDTISTNSMFCDNLLVQSNTTNISTANISGNININSNVTLNSITTTDYNIVHLKHFQTNYLARQGGIEKWELYRTGGIVKIGLDIIPPVITVNDLTVSTNFSSLPYNDSGVTSNDNDDGLLDVYLISVKDSTQKEYIASDILINGPTQINPSPDPFIVEQYTLLYKSTDVIGNVGTASKTLMIT